MADPPLQQQQHYFTCAADGASTWPTANPHPHQQQHDFAYAAPDAASQENWTDFMRWDPASSPHPQGAEGLPATTQPLQNRRTKAQLGPLSLAAHDQMFMNRGASDEGNAAYSFGEDPHSMNAFDFEFNALTSAPELSRMAKPIDSTNVWQQPSPIERDGSNGISPSSVKMEMTIAPAPLSSSSRSSVDGTPTSVVGPEITPPSSDGSPEPQPANTKKRKSPDMGRECDKTGRKNSKQQPVKKTAHNMIEKRYRTKLNDKIEELKNSVPSLKRMTSTGFEDDEEEELDGLTPAHKTNKATVLSKATEYIKHLEKKNKQLNDEMNALRAELEKHKKAALSATVPFNNTVTPPDTTQYPEDPFGNNSSSASSSHMPPQGMIPVPDSIMNLHANGANQPHYARAYPQYANTPRSQGQPGHPPMVHARGGGPPFNKFMVGALAGLMILEVLSEHEESGEKHEARGLFSLPVHLLGRRSAGLLGYTAPHGSSMTLLQLTKALLLLGALVYLISPLLEFRPRSKKKAPLYLRLSPLPSLASPIEVRQNAWLTAIQTVWVPHHNVFYELAALALKTVKLSTRRLIGWRGYSLITGFTKEQEVARVKAWKIALDAQLTGGDSDISISRLLLTLMASGTLPDSPARLMLKALHVRVLLWEIAKSGYGTWDMFDELSAKLSRRYWNAARTEHSLNALGRSGSRIKVSTDPDEQIESLPDHLAALLQLECDEVLIDCIVQRAYNLAWNKPSAHHAEPDESMDDVVEDFGISTPLDALAAWWSSYTLKRALTSSLASTSVTPSAAVVWDVELAVQVAPPASGAYMRAAVARAVLFDDERGTFIDAAMAALPLGQQSTLLENEVGSAPVESDLTVALTIAKCLSLLRLSTASIGVRAAARARATAVLDSPQVISPQVVGFSWTLLSFVAAYKALNFVVGGGEGYDDPLPLRLSCDPAAQRMAEKLAASLRLWVGREDGRRLGLSKSLRGKVIDRCLTLRKVLVGIREDEEKESGYGSAED